MPRRIAPHGLWESPISSDLVACQSVKSSSPAVADGFTYWIERRPEEGGRNVIMRRAPGGEIVEVIRPPFSARSRVHEYGGGAYAVLGEDVIFSNDDDQRLYRARAGREPRPVTASGAARYADGVPTPSGDGLTCVVEDHAASGDQPANFMALIRLTDGRVQRLAEGADFYSNPRYSPDGRRMCWLEWNPPSMPWDGTELRAATLDGEGRLGESVLVAGGPEESIWQPEWSPDGSLYFVSDRNGWWNLHRWNVGEVEPVVEMEAEFGYPQWLLGWKTYALESRESLFCGYFEDRAWRFGLIDPASRRLTRIECPYTDVFDLRAEPGRVVFRGGSPTQTAAIVEFDVESGRFSVLRPSEAPPQIPTTFIREAEGFEFSSSAGRRSRAYFYAPRNPEFEAPEGDRPPLIVVSHGGPTGQASTTLDWTIQFWTSRGFAVVDVDYGGSSGYGRAYRESLAGRWGEVDVEDCIHAALDLTERGLADRGRLIIRGGSAGGFTTLAALAFHDVFAAGASYYGVSDLTALARETHKFESRYLDKLVGPFPERRDIYERRSPIHAVESLNAPIIFFQGAEDKVVPPDQSEKMANALRSKGLPVRCLVLEGERHGFRKAETIRRALDAELEFYSSTLLGGTRP